uniref:Uncharacterized protein n=1 Tax=Lepeophtheirus salmonis TaxID=72036 RepID=A0A0K2VDF3_LEPSM
MGNKELIHSIYRG